VAKRLLRYRVAFATLPRGYYLTFATLSRGYRKKMTINPAWLQSFFFEIFFNEVNEVKRWHPPIDIGSLPRQS
jgi:hypothetical protein